MTVLAFADWCDCGLVHWQGGVLITTLFTGVAATGTVSTILPLGLVLPGDNYIVEIGDGSSKNFSHPFSIRAPYEYQVSAWSNCSQ